VTFTSREVWRAKSKEEGGGKEPLTLESNSVDLDISPADPVWVAGQLSDIEQALNTARDYGDSSSIAWLGWTRRPRSD